MASRPAPGTASIAGLRGAEWALPAFVALTLILGGGGAQTPPVGEMLLYLAGLAELALIALISPRLSRDRRALPAVLFLALTVAIAAAQLIPLPPALWHMFPGRALTTDISTLAGAGGEWRPFTLDPARTRAVALSLICPAAGFLGTLYASPVARGRVLVTVAAFAVIDLLVSVQQVAAVGSGIAFYDTGHNGTGIGFFANRNHNADLFLIAPLVAATLLRTGLGRRLNLHEHAMAATALGVFLVGIVTTTSRTGLMLIPLTLLGVFVLFASRAAFTRAPRARILAVLALLLLVLSAVVAFGANNRVVSGVLARFAAGGDRRFDFWPDVLYGIGQLWPFGSGSGTFDPMFRSFERLDTVLTSFVNHAHNDYLEVLFELGLVGALLIAVLLALFGFAVARTLFWRRGAPLDPQATAAIFALAILLLHSLVDYPMRTVALGTLFGVLAGLTFLPARLRGRSGAAS